MYVYRISSYGWEDYSPVEYFHEEKFTLRQLQDKVKEALVYAAKKEYEHICARFSADAKAFDEGDMTEEEKDEDSIYHCRDYRHDTIDLSMDRVIGGYDMLAATETSLTFFSEEMVRLGFKLFKCEQSIGLWGMTDIVQVRSSNENAEEHIEYEGDGVDQNIEGETDDNVFQREVHQAIRDELAEIEHPFN
jgi:hypothetical protein